MTRRPVPRTGSRRRAPARQASVTRPPPSDESRPASLARQAVPSDRSRGPGSRRRAPARQAAAARLRGKFRPTRPPPSGGPHPAGRARQAVPGDRPRGPGAAAARLRGKHPSRARSFRRAAPGRSRPATGPRGPVAAAARLRGKFRHAPAPSGESRPAGRALPSRPAPAARPRPFRAAVCPPRVQIKNIETASTRVSCDLRPLETLAFCAAAQDLGRCPKPPAGT